jgi:myo-inositol-1(or 4)-monophosphatase
MPAQILFDTIPGRQYSSFMTVHGVSTDLLLQVAVEAIQIGGATDTEYFTSIKSKKFQNKTINDNWDPVTEVDQLAEERITSYIIQQFPDHKFLGEENIAGQVNKGDHVWVVDPIDGTVNYIHGIPHFGVAVGYVYKGTVVVAACFDPLRDELFTAVRGQGARLNGEPISVSNVTRLEDSIIATGFYYDRGEMMERTLDSIRALFRCRIHGIRRCGSSVLDMCWTAAGRFDGYFEYELAPWDFTAASLILSEAGARVSRTDRSPTVLSPGSFVAATPGIYDELLEVIGD